jgi:hypothetical protein
MALGWPVMPDGQVAHWSIRPDRDALLAGELDAGLVSLLGEAPPGSLLTGWHEAEHADLPGTVAQQQAWVHGIHTYLHHLVHDTRSDVLYGPVTTMGSGRGWVVPGMDFYGVDLYDLHGTTDPKAALSAWSAKMPDTGYRVVAETNSSVKGHRPSWFKAVYEWLAGNHGIALETFWLPSGPLSGPWVDDDWPTISALRRVAESAGRPPWRP